MTCPLYVSGNYKLAKQLNSSLRQSRTRYVWALTLKNLQAENKDYWFEPSLFAETQSIFLRYATYYSKYTVELQQGGQRTLITVNSLRFKRK